MSHKFPPLKSSYYKTLTGTLGGVAEHYGIDYAWLKLSFGILALIAGIWAVAAYLILFLIMPDAKAQNLDTNIFARMAERLFSDLKQIIFRSRYSKIFGLTFLALGLLWTRGQGLTAVPAILLLLGAILLFDPFAWRKDTSELVVWQLPSSERPN